MISHANSKEIQKDSSKCNGGKGVLEVLEEYDLVSMYEKAEC